VALSVAYIPTSSSEQAPNILWPPPVTVLRLLPPSHPLLSSVPLLRPVRSYLSTMETRHWPYLRALPLDERDDVVELDFADTSALSDVDAFPTWASIAAS